MSAPKLSHQECWELLPWHATGTLDPDEAARVDEHLAACAICREELRACRELAAALPDAEADSDPEPGLARVMARIEREEAAAGGRWRRLAGSVRAALAATPRPVRAALAAQGAAIALLAAVTLVAAGGRSEPAPAGPAPFRTLSDPAAAAAPGAVRLRVVFAGEAPADAVRELLLDAGARVVDGPSRFGVYTVETTAAGGRGEELLARLQADPAVVFAEPALAAPAAGGAGR